MRWMLLIFLLIPSMAHATIWYTRDGGGTSTQCTGTTNAVYPGSGSNQPCAFSHPAWAIGGGYVPEAGSGYTTTPELIQSGDTLYIDGDSDITPGTQAQYVIGYNMPNLGYPAGSSYPANSGLNLIVAGTSGNNTQIIGTGTHQPQLWGEGGTQYVLEAQGGYVTFQNLEITSHSNCGYQFGVNACGSGTSALWVLDGIRIEDGGSVTGNNYLFQDMYIHNMKRYGIVAINDVGAGGTLSGTNTFTRVKLIGDQQGGFSTSGSASWTSGVTLNWNQPIAEWSGCQEAYPLTYAGIDNPLNYSNCTAQDGTDGSGTNAIIADNIDVGFSGSNYAGNWNITGPGSISFGTKNCLDMYHGTGSGTTVQIDKMRFEGCAGIAVKTTATNVSLTNNLIIADCGWWYGSAQAIAGGMGVGGSGVCRAGGDTFQFDAANSSGVINLYNNTIIANGNIDIENIGSPSTSVTVNFKNNLVLNGYSFQQDSTWTPGGANNQSTFLYCDGSDGNGTGCAGNLYTLNEDYNIVQGTHFGNVIGSCQGAHDICGNFSGFVAGAFPVGTAGGGANTYYQGQAAITLLPISSGSSAKGAGVSGLTYWNTSNDYYNVTRASPPSIGGLEYFSCAANTFAPCFFNSDCCSGICSSNVCAGTAPPTSFMNISGTSQITGTSFL